MRPSPNACAPRYFNSRSCEGATRREAGMFGPLAISTHAPVKERHSILAIVPARMRFQLTLL